MFTVVFIGAKGVGKTSFFNFFSLRYGKSKTKSDFFFSSLPEINYNESFLKKENYDFSVIDTPAFPVINSFLEEEIEKNIEKLIERECNLLCWIIDDIKQGDIFFLKKIFQNQKNKCVLLNKTDSKDFNVNSFRFLGSEKIFLVSIFKQESLNYFIDFFEEKLLSKNKKKKSLFLTNNSFSNFNIIIIGLPNSGKSTLMNLLLKKERSLVNDVSGTTKEPVCSSFFFNNNNYQLIDTQGANKQREIKKIFWEKSHLLIVLIDVTVVFNRQLLKLSSYGYFHNKPTIIVLNKIDLIKKKQDLKKNFLKFKNRLFNSSFFFLFLTSLKKKIGLKKIKDAIENIYKKKDIVFSKTILNNLTKKINEEITTINVFFIKQIKKKEFCFSFIFFVKNKKKISLVKKKNIERKVQNYLEINNLPIVIFFKNS